MKKNGRTLVSAAAISGLLAGVALNQGCSKTDSGGDAPNAATNAAAKVSPGKPAPTGTKPKAHDCAGENDCKGAGGCKTDEHACKFKNSCKGKGGCHVTDKDIQDWEKQQAGGAPGAGATTKTN